MSPDGSVSRTVLAGLVVLGAVSLAASTVVQSLAQGPAPVVWDVPEVGALPYDAEGRRVRRGRDLVTATYAHIGPRVPDRAKRFAGNNLACANCHLEAGTKKFG